MKRLSDDLIKNPIMAMPSDVMIMKQNFTKVYEVLIPERDEWQNKIPSAFRKAELVWFTDGSRRDGIAGSGVFCKKPKIRQFTSLGPFATVFQAEMYAIIDCVHLNLEYTGKRILILSDSQAALKALESNEVSSRLTLECINALNRLGSKNSICLGWVPGHSGIGGNEAADELARMGSSSRPIGPEPMLGVPKSGSRRQLLAWERHQANIFWHGSVGLTHSKQLIPGFLPKFAAEILKLNRSNIRILIRALTGHCKLNKHLSRMGLSENPYCRFCADDEETPLHILCECDALVNTRSRVLGGPKLTTQDAQALSPLSTVSFFRTVGLEEAI